MKQWIYTIILNFLLHRNKVHSVHGIETENFKIALTLMWRTFSDILFLLLKRERETIRHCAWGFVCYLPSTNGLVRQKRPLSMKSFIAGQNSTRRKSNSDCFNWYWAILLFALSPKNGYIAPGLSRVKIKKWWLISWIWPGELSHWMTAGYVFASIDTVLNEWESY